MRVRQRTHSLLVIWAPSRVRRVLRHRLVRAVGLVALGVTVASVLSAKAAALEQQRADWGTADVVLVVSERVEPGGLVAGFVEQQELPRAVVPTDSVDFVSPGSRAKVTLFPGEVLLQQRVTGASGSDETSALPDGMVALAVPIVRLVPFLSEGDLVDLWTVDSANFSSRRVATTVVVLALSEDEITIAVDGVNVGDVAAASLRPLTVTLVG